MLTFISFAFERTEELQFKPARLEKYGPRIVCIRFVLLPRALMDKSTIKIDNAAFSHNRNI